MAGWVENGTDRWVRDGDDRHLLLGKAGRLVELHGTTVHIYLPAAEVEAGNPLAGATYVDTWERPDLAEAATAALWRAMSTKQYTAALLPDPQP